MKIIDFSKSYMSWFGAGEMRSISRILLDGVCTLINSQGEKEVFYLIAPCRSDKLLAYSFRWTVNSNA